MNESLVIEIDRNLLSDAIELANKNHFSLSNFISSLIKNAVEYDKGEFKCTQKNSCGICLDLLPRDAKLYPTMDDLEQKMIGRALIENDNIQSHAASLLGITKGGFSQKMRKHNLK